MNQRHEQVRLYVLETIAEFIETVSNRTSLITATNVDLSPDFKHAKVFISVFPTDKEAGALDFLKRNRSAARAFMKDRSRTKVLPMVDFALDEGEKNRQHVDELLGS